MVATYLRSEDCCFFTVILTVRAACFVLVFWKDNIVQLYPNYGKRTQIRQGTIYSPDWRTRRDCYGLVS